MAPMTEPTRKFRRTRVRSTADKVIGWFVRAGLIPSTYLLTTTGRRSGRPLTHPATVVRDGERRWLVAPYGEVSWVHNARTTGRVRLARRRERADYTVRELPAAEAGPVLKRYVAIASATRPYFAAHRDAPVEAFTAEAHRHPVFELTPAGRPD
jgi:deazaflavin-dependent oxidoreductase (nitroreductase family)